MNKVLTDLDILTPMRTLLPAPLSKICPKDPGLPSTMLSNHMIEVLPETIFSVESIEILSRIRDFETVMSHKVLKASPTTGQKTGKMKEIQTKTRFFRLDNPVNKTPPTITAPWEMAHVLIAKGFSARRDNSKITSGKVVRR